jgi:hypothetical protein
MLRSKHVDFVFISTHSNELHRACIELLRSNDYQVLAEADLDATYSLDGLIVAKSDQVVQPVSLEINKKDAGGFN